MKRIVRMSVWLVVLIGMFANVGFAAEMKTVLFISTPQVEETLVGGSLKGLAQAGFVEQQNLTSVKMTTTPMTDPAEIATRANEVAPDVVIALGVVPVLVALQKTNIPTIAMGGVEDFVGGADGIPAANISGTYFMLRDHVYNSYKFFQKVAPLKAGQQAVFLDNSTSVGVVRKDEVVAALQRLQIPLNITAATTLEDFQEVLLRYNDEPDVGWILLGDPQELKRDGSSVNLVSEFLPLLSRHLNKPSIANIELLVQAGVLCGFGVDVDASAVQVGRMAARVLQGEAVQSIKAEYPEKVSIALNRKTATKLGIVFSMDVLNLANVIYDDYEGKQVIRK